MGVLKAPPQHSGIKIEETAPAGTHVAVCIKSFDQFGVQRRKYQSQEMEEQDVTAFYFGLKKGGKTYVVRTKEMKIVSGDKSNLVKFLNSWAGEAFPYGTDYTKWGEGRPAMITVVHQKGTGAKANMTYANVSTIAPLMEGLEKQVPKVSEFAAFLKGEDAEAPKTNTGTVTEDDQPPF